MSTSLCFTYVFLLGIALWRERKQRQFLDFLPSLSWFILMVAPYMLQKSDFLTLATPAQTFGVFCFGFTLLAADVAVRVETPNVSESSSRWPNERSDKWLLKMGLGLFLLSLAIQALHLILMPKIPLWQKYVHGITNEAVLSALRDEAAKNLSAPPGFLYLTQLTTMVLAPIVFAIALQLKRYLWAFSSLLLAMIYSRAALAKGPLFIILALATLILLFFLPPVWKKWLGITTAVVSSIVLITSGVFLARDPYSIFRYKSSRVAEYTSATQLAMPERPATSFVLADHYRALRLDPNYNQVAEWKRQINFFVYRAWLVPAEVSHRWYHFYPNVFGTHLHWYGLTPSSRHTAEFEHPSNTVGKWAYRTRFPSEYSETVHAYASVDADAYSRWGYLGILILALVTALIRFALRAPPGQKTWAHAVSYSALGLLSFSLPAASIFATLVAQGLLAYLVFFLVLNGFEKRHLL